MRRTDYAILAIFATCMILGFFFLLIFVRSATTSPAVAFPEALFSLQINSSQQTNNAASVDTVLNLMESVVGSSQSAIETMNALLAVLGIAGGVTGAIASWYFNTIRQSAEESRDNATESKKEALRAEEGAEEAAREAKATSEKIGNLEEVLEAVREQYQEQAEQNERQIASLGNRLDTLSLIFNFAIQLTLPNQLDEQLGIQGLIELSRTDDPVIMRQCMRLFNSIPEMSFASDDMTRLIRSQLRTRLQQIAADPAKGEYFRDEARRILERLDD